MRKALAITGGVLAVLVAAVLSDFRGWGAWSPWEKMDRR